MTVNQIYDVFLLIGIFVSFFNASATIMLRCITKIIHFSASCRYKGFIYKI